MKCTKSINWNPNLMRRRDLHVMKILHFHFSHLLCELLRSNPGQQQKSKFIKKILFAFSLFARMLIDVKRFSLLLRIFLFFSSLKNRENEAKSSTREKRMKGNSNSDAKKFQTFPRPTFSSHLLLFLHSSISFDR